MALAGSPAAAYYHFVHYTPNGLIQEKFDLRVLPGKTVTCLVSDAGLSNTIFGGTDSFPSALAQIRQATLAWNSVDTSDLRVAFGGLETVGTPQSTPGVDIVFEDMPPGVLAFTGHTTTGNIAVGPNGPFVPIMRSTVHLSRDFTQHPGPSYSELFYTTAVHELGHALGLQHTFTGAAMSTSVTRATSRARPVERDDIAGISLLYPKGGNFVSQFGSITGHVYTGGQGVHLASVVALRPNGSAVSALSNPDGSYRIDGLPAGVYWIYVHPLPPDANVTSPVDANGNPVPPSGPTETLFWAGFGNPGTRDPSQFGTVSIAGAGQVVSGVDFSVQSRAAVSIYDVSSYSYFGQSAVSPAYLNSTQPTGMVVAQGVGITSGSGAAPGLGIQLLGGFAPPAFYAYGSPPALAIPLVFPLNGGTGPRHLYFTLPNDAYVLPNGVNLTLKQPPAVSGATPNPDGSVTISGSYIQPDSRIFFDGQPAVTSVPFSGNDQAGNVTVQPPAGASGQTATITVYNSDGQNSMFVQSQAPQTYSYAVTGSTGLVFSPASLPAGTSSMVDVAATGNLRFVDGQVTLGFGSTDLTVQRIWVLSPTHLVANVTVAQSAANGPSEMSLLAGFQLYNQQSAFVTQPFIPTLPAVALPPVNANPAQSTIYPGAYVSLYGANLAISSGSATVTLGGQPLTLLYVAPNQINFQVPNSFSTGPAILNVNSGVANAFPVVVQIDPPPPVIVAVTSSSNVLLDATHAGLPGDTLQLLVANIDPTVINTPSRIRINAGGTDLAVTAILPVSGQSNVLLLQFILPKSLSGQQTQIYVSVDGSPSNPITIALRSS
ncbi:MAG TPA: IPT/TIG domain-containing protein [Bryobacteraceae bacterium]|nr:IPT/TIG domain-containing protein [Bryobacteraceae bacterium]